MRVIGGSAKRRSLKSPAPAHGVRPILGRVKKSLFDILRPRLIQAQFLDLYAGSGAVGIEALSRGAAAVTFVERNPNCISIIRQNVSKLQLFDRSRIVRADATRDLHNVGGPFDLIFMGPPYHDEAWNALHLTAPTLAAIECAGLLSPGGWVISQHHAKERIGAPARWHCFRQEPYGDTRLSFFTHEPA
jgi:16S rRNA (guanine966-N2)-methyltransferase